MVVESRFDAKRRMLASAALQTIAERGYARTGLREIAQHTELSHGSLHYYFSSKDDLVAHAVWNYKSECARRYDDILATATDQTELSGQVSATMAHTLHEEGHLHRLWYDLRNQAEFSDGFRDTIIAIDDLLQDMVWRIVSRYAELAGGRVRIQPELAYALFDGMFLNALIRTGRGDVEAIENLRTEAPSVLLGAAVG